uniref:Uncharacterized protein n=1 Tax=Hanusia phi TaxID=3032 RepID=A0A7S0HIM8_9CRYP|mmetsp:Transcript_24065/g.54003  ORF Transcript_24065/g.54003 Transcript_24065/m.54003 type:complete len:122 (+) Transcript_24065:74-439(+)
MQHSNKHGKVDATNGRKGMVVSLDVEEYSQFASIFGAPRIAGDDGPGELLQPFEDGLTWNVRWSKTGQVGNYYTGAFKLYHLRVGAHDTDKSSVDLIFRSLRQRIEGGGGGGLSDLTGKET